MAHDPLTGSGYHRVSSRVDRQVSPASGTAQSLEVNHIVLAML